MTLLEFGHEVGIALDQISPQALRAYACPLARSFTRFCEECAVLGYQSARPVRQQTPRSAAASRIISRSERTAV